MHLFVFWRRCGSGRVCCLAIQHFHDFIYPHYKTILAALRGTPLQPWKDNTGRFSAPLRETSARNPA
jgi:hypothetical protein